MTLRADTPGPDHASMSLTTPRPTQVAMGAPSNTTLIQGSGFTIHGGQFTTAARDVTVHNHYPHEPERGLASISPMNLIDGDFSESEIYCTQLLHQKRGFPLYVPGVQQTLPEEYRKRGVAIGDVGRITQEGSFDFFFNIYLPADHPINDNDVPENFHPLPPYRSKDLYDQSYLPGHHVSTPSVQRLDPDQDILPGGDFVFRCHSPQGAVLALPHGSHLQKLRNLDSVREYAATHAESWFRYVNGPRGRGLDGSLYLVTGSEKTSAWGMASFHSVSEIFQLTFMLPSGASGYRWRGNPAQRKYYDPSPMHEPYSNQTTFIHGLSISLGTGVWARMFETVQIREIANTESRLGGGGSNSTSSSHGSSIFSRILGFFGGGAGGGNDEQSRRHVVLSDFPAISQIMHPGELINNYILAKAPQATVVMSHDDDWCDIFGEGDPAQTISDLLQRIDGEYSIVEKGGATFLQAMSASSRNESPELFHGQVSVLTLDDNNDNNVQAQNALSTTISAPESDARASAQRESPTSINTLPTFQPTFAQPVSAVSPSPHSHNHGNVSSGGGFDDFEFDSDWGAILSSSGPTSASSPRTDKTSREYSRRPSQLSRMLRRPSTASEGSVMLDPDTFSAAVRGWGGEQYEWQRKYWTFRRDLTDERTARDAPPSDTSLICDAVLSPVPKITDGRAGEGKGLEKVMRILSRHGEHNEKDLMKRGGSGRREPNGPWRGMSLNAEEIWNNSLVGSFKVRRIELRPQKPQQRVTIDSFRGPFTIGPKPPHDGPYTNIHKHSKVMAFSIHRYYKPTRAPLPGADARRSIGMVSGSLSTAMVTVGGEGRRGRVRTVSGKTGHASAMEERRRLPVTILLAPTHVQVAYTSTNTTKMLRSHGLLDEKPFAEEPMRTPRWAPLRRRKRRHDSLNLDSDLDSGPDSDTDTDTERVSSWTTHNEAFSTIDSDLDSDTECMSSRTTHNEAFSTMDASLVRRVMWLPQDASTEGSNRSLSRFVRRGPVHPTHGAPHQVYIPPWVTLQSRAKQEERRRRHGVLSNSFEDIEVLPPKKSKGGTREKTKGGTLEKSTGGTLEKNVPAGGTDIFAQVPSDALFMLLPLWPGPTDPVSERNATRQPHEIPTEQRQYLLVSYKGTDEHAPPSSKKHVKGDRRSKKGSSHSSLMSSADGGRDKGCNILWTSYHISARLVSHADLQGSGVRAPAEGLAVLGPWHEARLTMPPIATRDHGLLVIGTCASRDAGIEFDPEGLVRLGLGVPVPPDAALDEPELQEKPVAELTPIGKAVLEMAWIGGIAVTSFGPAGPS